MKAFVLIKNRAGDENDAVAIIESPDLRSIGTLIASSVQLIAGVEPSWTCLAADV